MNLLLCLAATTTLASLCQAARIPRGAPGFPHFHSVHHGYGATSYQNVQIENYGSVPIPTEDHYHHDDQEQQFIIHFIGEINHNEHDNHEISVSHEIPETEQQQRLGQLIIVEKDHPEIPFVIDDAEHAHFFIPVDEVSHVSNDIEHTELHEVPDFSFYHHNFAEIK